MEELVQRRILLAKEFYLHAAERSLKVDSISKMMAIHNFHIAVEIVLKAIILKYDVPTAKPLNQTFESMMSEIDKYVEPKLTYRKDLLNLNQTRNLVQHHAHEPHHVAVEEHRVITKRFLEFAYSAYFDAEFAALSRIDFVADQTLKALLKAAQNYLKTDDAFDAAIRVLAAFQFASISITRFLPSEGFDSTFFILGRLRNTPFDASPFTEAIQSTHSRVNQAEKLSAILSSGVTLSDLKRLHSLPLILRFSVTGTLLVQTSKDAVVDAREVAWSIEFVTSCIILWQQQGLEPETPDKSSTGIDALLDPTYRYSDP